MSAVQVVSPVGCFEPEVVAVHRMSPSFVRITLGGACLAHLDDGGPLGPRDLRIKLVLPVPGGVAPPLADLSPGWYPRWLARDPRERGEMRTYTVRAVRPAGEATEVDLDMVLHRPAGPASRWAACAERGDRVVLLGPDRRSPEEYGGIEWAPPAGVTQVLLVADESAVPAVASVLATLPAGYAGRAVLEVPHAEDVQHLRTAADVEVTWLARGDHPRGALLVDAVRDAVRDVGPGTSTGAAPYAWVAGEAGVVRTLRRLFLGEVGVPRERTMFMGYWRTGRAEG